MSWTVPSLRDCRHGCNAEQVQLYARMVKPWLIMSFGMDIIILYEASYESIFIFAIEAFGSDSMV